MKDWSILARINSVLALPEGSAIVGQPSLAMESASICGPLYHRVATLPKTKPKQCMRIAPRGDSCWVKRLQAFRVHFLDRKEQMKTKTSKSTKPAAVKRQQPPGSAGKEKAMTPAERIADYAVKDMLAPGRKQTNALTDKLINSCLRRYFAEFNPKKSKLIAEGDDASLYQAKDGQYFLWKCTAFLDGKRMAFLQDLQDAAPGLIGVAGPAADAERERRIRYEHHAVPMGDKAVLDWVLETQVADGADAFLRGLLKMLPKAA